MVFGHKALQLPNGACDTWPMVTKMLPSLLEEFGAKITGGVHQLLLKEPDNVPSVHELVADRAEGIAALARPVREVLQHGTEDGQARIEAVESGTQFE